MLGVPPGSEAGSGDGIVAENSTAVDVVRTTARAGTSVGGGRDGGHGLRVLASNVYLFGSELFGGPGRASDLEPGGAGGPGISQSGTTSFVMASGCRVEGGPGGEGTGTPTDEGGCNDGGAGGAGEGALEFVQNQSKKRLNIFRTGCCMNTT